MKMTSLAARLLYAVLTAKAAAMVLWVTLK